MSVIDVISDHSNKNLDSVPEKVLDMYNLKMLYLEGNMLEYLPEDFFTKLSRLTWLDLRRNKLTAIPTGIAHHSCLETMLLQENQIENLPNEIGLVPNLQVLQLAGNPLKYPVPELVDEGVAAISSFLKQEYYKENEDPVSEDDEEREISVVEPKGTPKIKSADKLSIKELLRRSARKRMGHNNIMPVINVKSLSKVNPDNQDNIQVKKSSYYAIAPSSAKKTHKMTRGCSKISLKSQSQWIKKKPNADDRAHENELKEVWLKRLQELLSDQEKILQQEKNLKALSKWRLEKKMEVPRPSVEQPIEAPFAVDPEYNQMLTRKDLTRQIDQMIKKSKKPPKKAQQTKKADIQKLINQVVDQMKTMESKLSDSRSPRAEQAIATKQIESIVELHKKIIKLQAKNEGNL